MSQDAYQAMCQEPGEITVPVRIIGTGAAAPTKVWGRDITMARSGVGVYTMTFGELPGAFAGIGGYGFDAATPLNVAGCTIAITTPSAGAKVITVTVYSGGTTPAARELAATEVLTMRLIFKKLSV